MCAYRVLGLTYDDSGMDVDGTGRFNAADVLALGERVGSDDPNDLAKWDFNSNGTIDDTDVGVLSYLVSQGYDSGVLGDTNGDGLLNCTDLVGIDSLFMGLEPVENISFDDDAPADTWIPMSVEATVPPGVTQARIALAYLGSGDAAGEVHFDAAYAYRGSVPNTNQLSNASFEQGPGGLNGISDWQAFGWGDDAAAVMKSCFELPSYQDGICSAMVTGFGEASLVQDIAVSPGETLDVGAYLYTPSGNKLSGAHAGLRVEWVYCDPNYVSELDANLDGRLDESDRHWVYQAIVPGDITADGAVDLSDLSSLLAAYGSCDGDPLYYEYADINQDGCVDLADLAIPLAHYGEHCE